MSNARDRADARGTLSASLLDWYDVHARVLPWRTGPADGKRGLRSDPYHVWLSEVMLQQTTVAAVKAYFEKFVGLWPSVADLAAADRDDIMSAWAGLGYYSRARNLKACADQVVSDHGGQFPSTRKELRALPGIGDYTSAAISAIAFGQREAVVDGNIERVSLRQLADATPLPKGKEVARAFMEEHTPLDRPGDFVQAMMDLGATICTPRNPVCGLCPISSSCEAHGLGTMLDFPVKAPKKVKPTRCGAVFVVTSGDRVWLVRRGDKGLLGGTTGLPTNDWSASTDGATDVSDAPVLNEGAYWDQRGTISHTFTHFHLELTVWQAESDSVSGTGWWAEVQNADEAGLSTVMAKALRKGLA